MKKKNKETLNGNGSNRIDAVLVLLAELVRQLSTDKESAQVAREKAAAVLVSCGISQERAGKLIGMQKSKVVEATKTIKI